MRGARIVGTGRELPPRVVKNEELTKLMDTTDEWTGPRPRHPRRGRRIRQVAATEAYWRVR